MLVCFNFQLQFSSVHQSSVEWSVCGGVREAGGLDLPVGLYAGHVDAAPVLGHGETMPGWTELQRD